MGNHTAVIWFGNIIQNWSNILGIIFQHQSKLQTKSVDMVILKKKHYK